MAQSVTIRTVRTGAGETLTISGTSAVNATAFPAGTGTVRVCATTNIWVRIGQSPTASANNDFYLPAGVIEYFTAAVGEKVAAIQDSAAGSAYIIPCE